MSSKGATENLPPPPVWYRWSVLVVASVAMAGNYYVYDAIAPLADLLRSRLSFTDADIGLLNGIYSAPNIIMVVIGGLIIDRIGTRKSAVIFGVLCFIGACVTAASGELYVMAAGRLIFGLGAESLIVCITAALAKWFRGKELSLAFGLNLTIARLGTFTALNSPTWARAAYSDWQYPLIIAAVIGSLCVIAAILYYGMEATAEKKYTLGTAEEPDKVVFKDLFRFGRSYWYVVLLCMTFYGAIFPFMTFAVKLFQDVHGISREGAGGLASMLILFSMVMTPIFGYVADRVGKRATFMVFGSLLLIPVYLVMAYIPMRPGPDIDFYFATLPQSALIGPMAVMGVAFSLIPAVMWPSVAYLVDQSRLGTGLGLMTMIQNIGLAGMNFLVGWMNTHYGASAANPGGYAPGMWAFTGLIVFAVLFAFLLLKAEKGPNARGLETITTKSQQADAARSD